MEVSKRQGSVVEQDLGRERRALSRLQEECERLKGVIKGEGEARSALAGELSTIRNEYKSSKAKFQGDVKALEEGLIGARKELAAAERELNGKAAKLERDAADKDSALEAAEREKTILKGVLEEAEEMAAAAKKEHTKLQGEVKAAVEAVNAAREDKEAAERELRAQVRGEAAHSLNDQLMRRVVLSTMISFCKSNCLGRHVPLHTSCEHQASRTIADSQPNRCRLLVLSVRFSARKVPRQWRRRKRRNSNGSSRSRGGRRRLPRMRRPSTRRRPRGSSQS